MKLRRHISALFLVACCGCDSPAPNMEIGFSRIVINETTPNEVIALMNAHPRRRHLVQLLDALDVQVMEYENERHTFVLAIGGSPRAGVEPRVVAKAMHPRKGVKK